MAEVDWDRLIADADKAVDSSDRKFRKRFKSLDAMSEEAVYRESMALYDNGSDFDADDDMFGSVKNPKLKKALESLPPKHQTVVYLFFWRKLNQTEIADIMGCSQRNISGIISKAKRFIKDYMT
jgi:RNA polymerase sigma factor (sigma-70 family)